MKRTGIKTDPAKVAAWLDKSRRTSTLGRGPGPKRTKGLRKRNPERAASEFARCFHSKARVAFVKALPCCIPGCRSTPCDNAHTTIGGTGYRADYTTIAPLCRAHHQEQEGRSAAFERDHDLPAGFLATCASETDGRWQTQMNR